MSKKLLIIIFSAILILTSCSGNNVNKNNEVKNSNKEKQAVKSNETPTVKYTDFKINISSNNKKCIVIENNSEYAIGNVVLEYKYNDEEQSRFLKTKYSIASKSFSADASVGNEDIQLDKIKPIKLMYSYFEKNKFIVVIYEFKDKKYLVTSYSKNDYKNTIDASMSMNKFPLDINLKKIDGKYFANIKLKNTSKFNLKNVELVVRNKITNKYHVLVFKEKLNSNDETKNYKIAFTEFSNALNNMELVLLNYTIVKDGKEKSIEYNYITKMYSEK